MGVKNGIEHLDTNVVVRLLTHDNEHFYKRALKLISKKSRLYVFEDASMMELVYVLSGKVYNYPREKTAAKVKAFMCLENLSCNKSIFDGVLDLFVARPKLSFVDCYLAIITDTTQEASLWTFDRELLKNCPLAREP